MKVKKTKLKKSVNECIDAILDAYVKLDDLTTDISNVINHGEWGEGFGNLRYQINSGLMELLNGYDIIGNAIHDYQVSVNKSKKDIQKRAFSDLERFVDVHYKEVNGESYGEGHLTDDGWYDDEKYKITWYDEIKISNRIFKLRSVGGGRVTFVYTKWIDDDLSYDVELTVPSYMAGFKVEWHILDREGNEIAFNSYEVSDGEPSQVAEQIKACVRACLSEVNGQVKRMMGDAFMVDDSLDLSAKKCKSKQNHSKSMRKAIAKRYMGDESDPDWDAMQGRWRTGGDTHVKIYQISGKKINDLPEDDPEYLYFMKHKFRDDKEGLDLSYYDQQWEGDMNVHSNLDDLYGMMQDYRPIETSHKIYSLSVGDLIEMDGKLYMVDDYGFSEINDIKRSAKKMKKIPEIKMDFEANVNKLRKCNYDKIGKV